jgi:RND family efflux transporter MFP subunit
MKSFNLFMFSGEEASRLPRHFFTVDRLLLVALFFLLAGLSGCGDSNAAAPSNSSLKTGGPPPTRLRVRVDSIRMDRLEGVDRVAATVRAFHRATLTAETQGRVLSRSVEPGAEVEVGGVILELESSRFALDLRRSEASLRAARTVLAHAEREFGRGKRLKAQSAISTQKLDDLRHAVDRALDEVALSLVARDTARRNLEDTRIVAPFAGSVDSISVDIGDFVAAGTPIATLVDLSRVRIFGGVTAQEAARLTPGTKARVTFADLGGDVFEATLASVGRVAAQVDGTYGIELWMSDESGQLRDGMVAQIELSDQDETPRLLARRAALLRRDGHPEVFVIEGEGEGTIARTRRLRTGRTQGQWVEILDGLSVGDRVVWDGHFALRDGTAVIVDGESSTSDRAVGGEGRPSAPAAQAASASAAFLAPPNKE